jgi:hypothetical protein
MQDLILKTYGMEAVKVAQYGAGVSLVVGSGKLKSNTNPYNKFEPIQKDTPLYKSALGTPVFCNFEIQAGTWTEEDGTVHEWPFLRYDTVLIDVTQTKLIKKTEIQGRPGTVKEFIADGDYMVNIKLLIVGSNGVMPLQEVEDLKKALDAPVALAVNSRYLQNLGVDNIVVENYSMPQVEGGYSYQAVEIRASSDEPIELKIK